VAAGWYGGKGGRLLACVPTPCGSDLPPLAQPPQPRPDPVTGLVDAGWNATHLIRVASTWISGYYIALIRLTTASLPTTNSIQGKTHREAIRCLKRHLARPHLAPAPNPPPAPSQTITPSIS
jgi:hypothetical protein